MNVRLPGLVVDVEARIDKLEKSLARANRTQRRSARSMERRAKQSADRMRSTYGRMGDDVSASFLKMGGALKGGLIGALGIAGISGAMRSISQITKGVAQIGDEAKRAGMSLESFQEWSFVAKTNRISVDSLIDGFKELNLRADEFIVTGKGPAVEAFERLGFSAEELKTKLKDPSELMLEIIGQMKDLDRAAQIRVSDEIFGGSAGERFVELLGRGEDGLRRTIGRAHELGLVLDADVIRRADELDRKFTALAAKASTFGKKFAVGIAQGTVSIANGRETLDNLNNDVVGAVYDDLAREADIAANQLLSAAQTLRTYGETLASEALITAANEMRALSGEIADGTIETGEFEEKLSDTATQAAEVFANLNKTDRIDFSGAISAVGKLIRVLATATAQAGDLRSEVESAAMAGSGRGDGGSEVERRNRDGNAAPTDLAPKKSRRPRAAPPMLFESSYADPTGSGGSNRLSEYELEIAAIAEATVKLQLEGQALIEAAGAQTIHGNAMEFAKTKADLLAAALRSGMDMTPEILAQIDQMAGEYAKVGNAAELAANKLLEVQNASARGAETIADVFQGMATGALSAKEAVGQLIMQVIQLSLKKRLLEAANNSGGSFFGSFLKLLGGGFAVGGYTGDGGKNEPAGIVHRGEYVMSKAATKSIGVGNLEAMHNSAKRGYSGGGLVGLTTGAGSDSASRNGRATAPAMAMTINAPVTVQGSAGSPDQNTDLAKRMSRELTTTVKAIVGGEMRQAMRPGNMLNRGR